MRDHDDVAELATAILTFRRNRAQRLPPELFAEPGWDLMLELVIADAHGKRITARAVATRSATPHAVMARWLKHLSAIGLVVGDGVGDLDDPLTLSGIGMDYMEQTLQGATFSKGDFSITT